MRAILTVLFLPFLAGCLTLGSFTEGRPRHQNKFPADTAFFISKTEPRVQKAFQDALKARGFEIVENEEACDYVIKAEVTNWEYNDAGFSGFHSRDDISLSIRIVDRRSKLIESRATVEIRSDFGIVKKFVETF